MTVPAYLPYYVLVGSAAMLAALLWGLRNSLAAARWPQHEQTSTFRTVALVLLGWFAVAVGLALLGVYADDAERYPTIQYGIMVPILIGSVLIWRSQAVSRLIDAIPQRWLVGIQTYRALGAIFLVLYASGKAPGLFALPAGIGDVLVGVLAPIVAIAYARRRSDSAGLLVAWNLLGIADLVVAVGTGFATGRSPLQLAAFDAPNDLISIFPLVLIPTYLVPLWILLHIASLTKLRRAVSHSSDPVHGARSPA
jgi:hypothetical protein